MSLPASQRRALNQIEKTLADDYPGLGPLFGIFARLAGREAMPATERVTARPWRRQRRMRMRMRPAVVTLVGLAMFILSLRLSGPQECSGTVTTVTARTQYVPAERQLACAPPHNKPSKTSQSGHHAH